MKNQIGINRATGFTAEGSLEEFSWRVGIYSNDTPTNTAGSGELGDGEFGDLNGGISTTLGVGYDLKGLLHTEQAGIHLDWLHSDREAGDFVLARYDDIVSTTFVMKQDTAALVIESFFAAGGDGNDSDVYGFYIQPTYDIIPKKLQLVGRYSYANSAGPQGVISQSRYEKPLATGSARGDNYNAFYGGIQYFIYGDKLKVLAGAEWAQLKGNGEAYQGTTLLTGIRFSF